MAGPWDGVTRPALARASMRASDDSEVVGRPECIGVDARPLGVNIDLPAYVWAHSAVMRAISLLNAAENCETGPPGLPGGPSVYSGKSISAVPTDAHQRKISTDQTKHTILKLHPPIHGV
jgi:hypothetical protein